MKILIIIFILLYPLQLLAGVTGKLSGTITDADTKEPLVGVNVTILGTNLGASTDINGKFIIINIHPGTYSVRISAVGYETIVVSDVKIIVDQTTTISVSTRKIEVPMEEVIITAERPMIQKDKTSSISVVTREMIEAMPVSNFTEIVSLQAGVVGSGSNLHIRGGRSNEVAYLVDGMYVKDPLLGSLATQVNNDAIQELILLSGTFNAEYGNALSGVVNIVTREGTEKYNSNLELRTSEFGIERYSKLRENRVNGSISGPVFSEKIKLFLSGEVYNKGSYLPFGYDRTKTFFSKLSFSQIPSMKFTFSNRGSKRARQSYNHAWKYIPEQFLRSRTDSWQNVFTLSHSLSQKMFYDLRLSYFNQGYYSGVDKDTSQYIKASQRKYLPDKGNGYEFYERADPLEIIDSRTVTADAKIDFVWQLDNINELKFGGNYKKHWMRLFNIYDPKRDFPYIDNYKTYPFEAAFYIQDKMEFPYLIVNVGLRYDYLNANVEFRNNPLDPTSIIKVKPRTQISPRIGIAHPITERTKLHFSYGHFFQNPDYQYLFENKQYDLNVREPIFGQPNLDAERTIAYEVGFAHQFSDRIALHVSAYYKDVTGLIGTHYYFPYIEGRYVGYTLYVNEDYANIKGLEVNLDIRPDQYFSGGLTYTYSVAKGSASSESEQYPGTQESTLLYYLDFDKTHVLNVIANFRIPKGEGPSIFGKKLFEHMYFNFIGKASSGYPYTPGGRDVGFVIKNSLRRPATYSIDLELGKEIYLTKNLKLRIFSEILNLTDRKNVLYVYPDTGDPDFTYEGAHSIEWMRNPANYGPPRSIKLGVGLNF